MPIRATNPNNARMSIIPRCYLIIPGTMDDYQGVIYFNVMPSLSDSKSAKYNEEPVIGRSSNLITYSNSDTRSISLDIHLMASSTNGVTPGTFEYNLNVLRAVESAAYPREGQDLLPYMPPPVCRLKCGQQLAKEKELCVIMEKYSVKFDPQLPFHPEYLIPFKFSISTSWKVVYKSEDLPGQNRIWTQGR